MTRARLFALAALAGLCCLGHRSAIAQSGPDAPAYGYPGPAFAPGGSGPMPPDAEPWYGSVDEVQAAGRRVGPRARVDGTFLRVEYLNYNFKNPGHELLGAPVAGVADPTKPFLVFPPGAPAPLAFAVVPSTQSIDLSNTSGVQVTGGMSFIDGGSLEVSAFMLARKQSGFRMLPGQNIPFDTDFDGTIDPPAVELAEGESLPLNVATSTLFHGQLSDHVFLYNVSYQAVMQSQLWGGEANYFFDVDDIGMLRFRPLIGARYLNLTERLTQVGVFQDILPGPPIVTTIDSHATNNLWGPQIGFRTQIVTKYLEVGLTPKLLFLGNTAQVNVFTNHLRSNVDPVVGSGDHTTTFSFGADVGTYAQLNLSPHFSIRGGYNLLWLNRVTRPHKDVYYNDNGPLAPPAVVSRTVFSDILINGFSVGAQFQW
ncbi:MAG: BBP7 family outer membrane beta-barrel protein [Deltaproteobacteria bacterium]